MIDEIILAMLHMSIPYLPVVLLFFVPIVKLFIIAEHKIRRKTEKISSFGYCLTLLFQFIYYAHFLNCTCNTILNISIVIFTLSFTVYNICSEYHESWLPMAILLNAIWMMYLICNVSDYYSFLLIFPGLPGAFRFIFSKSKSQ